jgi:hypothetical protein
VSTGQTATTKSATKVAATDNNAKNGAATGTASAQAPPGLDAQRHAADQLAARAADLLRKGVFASLMADALGFERVFDATAVRIFLEVLLRDAGNPSDPVEVMLLEQLTLAHFRIAQLHVAAGGAQGLEATKLLNGATSRLLGEFRRTCLALRAYRGRAPQGKAGAPLKLFKAAQ